MNKSMESYQRKFLNESRLKCFRCGHRWYRRSSDFPGQCPRCHNPYYYKPRKKRGA